MGERVLIRFKMREEDFAREKELKEGHKRSLRYAGVMLIGLAVGQMLVRGFNKTFPRTNQVQQGFVAPSNLEIECEDLDGKEGPETMMVIDGKRYSLKYDKQGKPVLSIYPK